jgi:PAS domain S-box-containing protein
MAGRIGAGTGDIEGVQLLGRAPRRLECAAMGDPRDLALWLVRSRGVIEAQLGDARPAPDSAEAEALRRFRSFALAALQPGRPAAPALEGLRVSERRANALVDAWLRAAAAAAGPNGEALRATLAPLAERFRAALCAAAPARRKSGAPRTRRAVVAAIDRVADAFLAVDADSGTIEDANPAAGALLGTTRDALLGSDALRYVAEPERQAFEGELDAVAEGSEPRWFRCALVDGGGRRVSVDASVTRFRTRGRTLALFVARPAS